MICFTPSRLLFFYWLLIFIVKCRFLMLESFIVLKVGLVLVTLPTSGLIWMLFTDLLLLFELSIWYLKLLSPSDYSLTLIWLKLVSTGICWWDLTDWVKQCEEFVSIIFDYAVIILTFFFVKEARSFFFLKFLLTERSMLELVSSGFCIA